VIMFGRRLYWGVVTLRAGDGTFGKFERCGGVTGHLLLVTRRISPVTSNQ
jgi:hypothetical protein